MPRSDPQRDHLGSLAYHFRLTLSKGYLRIYNLGVNLRPGRYRSKFACDLALYSVT